MKKAWVVFVLGMLVLCGAVLWEYVFDRRNQEDWVGDLKKTCTTKREKLTRYWLILRTAYPSVVMTGKKTLFLSDSGRAKSFSGPMKW